MARILTVGTATLDLVFGLDHAPHADEEMRAQSLRVCRGGNAGNTAVVLRRLGHQVEFLGTLADAPETATIICDFESHGVVFSRCPRLPGRAPTSSIYLTQGARSIVHYRDLPELDLDTLLAMDGCAYDWLHFEGRNVRVLAEALSSIGRQAPDATISLELEKVRPDIETLVPFARVLLCSKGYAMGLGCADPRDFIDRMHRQYPQATIILAWGEAGAFGTAQDGLVRHAPAIQRVLAVDTLGAGDTFNAAVIDALSRGCDLTEALYSGCRLAGAKCGILGFDLDLLL
jgi:ketohexokinase